MGLIPNPFTGASTQVVSPSGDVTGVKDAAAITAAAAKVPAGGGTVTLAATGPWYVKCGQVVINRSGLYINAPGCLISAVGAGDVFRMYDSSSFFARTVSGGGLTGYPTIDGTATTGKSSALHLGDIFQAAVYARAQNFTDTSDSKGFWFDNNYYWTEQLTGDLYAANCRNHFVLDNSTGTSLSASATGSFDRLIASLFILAGPQTASPFGLGSGNGLAVQGGAFSQNFDLGFYGNMFTATTQYAACLITGSNGAGNSFLNKGTVNWGLECDDTTNTPPYTIQFGASGNSMNNIAGFMDFSGSNPFTASNKSNNFSMIGEIYGDATLASALNFLPNPFFVPAGFGLGNYSAPSTVTNGSTISAQTAPYQTVTNAGATTANVITAGFWSGQVLSLTNVGTGSITFAAAATSHVADGTGSVISTGENAMYLWDSNESLWYRVKPS